MDEVIPLLKYADDDGQLSDEINTAYEMLVDTVPLLRDEETGKSSSSSVSRDSISRHSEGGIGTKA